MEQVNTVTQRGRRNAAFSRFLKIPRGTDIVARLDNPEFINPAKIEKSGWQAGIRRLTQESDRAFVR